MANKKINRIYRKLANKYKLSEEDIIDITNSPYKFSKDIMDSFNLKNITEEDFNKLETNFIYKYLGKLYTKYNIVKKNKINRININKNINGKN